MAESFGNSFSIVEVSSDDPKPVKQMWIALAKPAQALIPAVLNERQLKLFQQIELTPGDVYRVDPN